jgi:hypothetical protein
VPHRTSDPNPLGTGDTPGYPDPRLPRGHLLAVDPRTCVAGEKLLEMMGIKTMVPKKELPITLRWNLPLFFGKARSPQRFRCGLLKAVGAIS